MTIEMNRVHKSFTHGPLLSRKNTLHVLHDITFYLKAGELAWLKGPNGSGKTTLLKLLAMLLVPDSGAITLDGIDLVEYPHRCKPLIGLSLGRERGLYQRLTARQNLMLFAALGRLSPQATPSAISQLIQSVEFNEPLDIPVAQYSEGAKSKLDLVRTLLHQPKLLLIDEPFHALDDDSQHTWGQFLSQYAFNNKIVVIASHAIPPSLHPTHLLQLHEGSLTSSLA